MSLYQVQKLIQSVNRDQNLQEKFLKSRQSLIKDFDLMPEEQEAIIKLHIGKLYKMGVHPLLLRPFSIIHGISETEYLSAIREKGHTPCP